MGIVDLVTVRQVAQLLREIYDDGCRRCAEDLQQFTGPLNDWVDELLQRQLPDNWREQLRDYLAEQEPKGYRIEPENLPPLEDWIHDWAEYRGLLPTTGGEVAARMESDATDQPFVMAFTPNASGPPDPGGAPIAPAATFANGFEVAGPGPEVTASFKAKVQQALDILDPRVGNWWQANSVRGLVRARAFWLKSYESRMEANEQPVVIVDQNYTAGQSAQAIIAEVSGGWFADSIGAFYKKYKFARTGDYQEFLAWQQGAVGEAAKLASVLAEFYLNGIATLTPAGDLIVTLGDVTERGPRWDQLISVLPYVSYLPIGAIVLKLGKREARIPKGAAQRLEKLTEKERKSILATAATAGSDEEATAIMKREIARQVGNRQIHHPISETVYKALEKHKNLRGKYRPRDERFASLAITYEAHQGYEKWHRELDQEVKNWIEENGTATEAVFEAWLRQRYAQPDLRAQLSTRVLRLEQLSMQFYSLDKSPDGDAETCAWEEAGHGRGDAQACPNCGSIIGMLEWLPPFRVDLKLYGKEFGDFVFLPGSHDFLVSQKFRDVYHKHGITGLANFDPVEVIAVKSRRKRLSKPPMYFRVLANYGQTAIDLAASGFEWIDPPTCSLCRNGIKMRWKRLVLEEGTWTGEDAFRPRGLSGTTMVSQRFKDVCEQHDIKNAVFIPADESSCDFYPGLKNPSELDRPSR